MSGSTPLQKEKKQGQVETEPHISASVGIRCKNLPEDVATVRGMLGLATDGGADEVLFDAIKNFQKGIDDIKPDGKIELPREDGKGKSGRTWMELFKSVTGHYPDIAQASSRTSSGASSRPVFSRVQSVVLSGDEAAA